MADPLDWRGLSRYAHAEARKAMRSAPDEDDLCPLPGILARHSTRRLCSLDRAKAGGTVNRYVLAEACAAALELESLDLDRTASATSFHGAESAKHQENTL